jgi:hypothetical protein
MSEVDALFRLLTDAPPRSAEIVKRVALHGLDLETVAKLYGVDVPHAQILVFRALLDVSSGGKARVPDSREPSEVSAMIAATPGGGEGAQARKLWDQLSQHRDELKAKLEKAAAEYAASPDRDRDEWLRRAAIVLVLALTAFFYWREKTKPLPLHQKRPIIGARDAGK